MTHVVGRGSRCWPGYACACSCVCRCVWWQLLYREHVDHHPGVGLLRGSWCGGLLQCQSASQPASQPASWCGAAEGPVPASQPASRCGAAEELASRLPSTYIWQSHLTRELTLHLESRTGALCMCVGGKGGRAYAKGSLYLI